MPGPLLAFASKNDPTYIVITDETRRHQAFASFAMSNPSDSLVPVPEGRFAALLARLADGSSVPEVIAWLGYYALRVVTDEAPVAENDDALIPQSGLGVD